MLHIQIDLINIYNFCIDTKCWKNHPELLEAILGQIFNKNPFFSMGGGITAPRISQIFGTKLGDQNGRKLHETDFARKIPNFFYKQFYFLPKIPKFQWEVVFPVLRFLRFSARSQGTKMEENCMKRIFRKNCQIFFISNFNF